MKLIALSVAWVFGIYIGSLVSLPFYGFLTALILPLLVALLYRKRMALLWAALCLVTLFGGIACYEWRVSEPTLQSFNGYGVVEMRGEVYRDPESAGGVARLSLKAQEIGAGGPWEEVSGKVLIYTTVFPSYSLGDLVEITGELHAISEVTESSYKDYLMRQGFSSTMSYPQIEFRERGWLLGVRNRLSESLSYALPEPQGALDSI